MHTTDLNLYIAVLNLLTHAAQFFVLVTSPEGKASSREPIKDDEAEA